MEQTLKSVGKAKSPVEGESFPSLDPDYKKQKRSDGLPPIANLESSGDMLDALDFKTTREGVEIGFFGKEAWKADGHLKFSGEENNIPQRRFLPAEGQKFVPEIQTQVDRIISDARAGSADFEGIEEVETKSELYDFLGEKLGLESRQEIRLAAIRNKDLLDILDENEILDLL